MLHDAEEFKLSSGECSVENESTPDLSGRTWQAENLNKDFEPGHKDVISLAGLRSLAIQTRAQTPRGRSGWSRGEHLLARAVEILRISTNRSSRLGPVQSIKNRCQQKSWISH